MKSSKLKETYREKYENFFTTNTLVISLPLLLNWAGDIFSNYKWIRIKQKLPLRLYIGINKIPEQKILFHTIDYFDLDEEKFIKSNVLEYAPFFLQYQDYFNQEYAKEMVEHGGIEINIFAELSRGVGLWFSSVLTLLFFVGLERYYHKARYILWENIEINELLNIPQVESLFKKTLKLNRDLGKRVNRIESQIASFFDSYYPIVSFTEDIDDHLSNLDLAKIRFYGYRLNTLDTDLSSVPFIPIDYGLIYSWSPVLTDHIIDTNENSFQWTTDAKEKCHVYFQKDLAKTLPIRKPLFYKTFVDGWEDEFKETYGKLMGAISLEMLHIMTKLFSSSYTESTMKNFIDVVNKCRFWNYITRKRSTTFALFIDNLLQSFSGSAKFIGISPSDTSVMGGTVIFTLPLEGFRKNLILAIDETEKKIPWVSLIYANWLDGIENRGLVIEQDLEHGVYGAFVSKGNFVLKSEMGTRIIRDITHLEKNMPMGLTLDLVNRKMYLDGEKLTSKDLHSQSTTIDVLEILLANLSQEVSSTLLPISSYSSSKNEMLGKIIFPLLKLIEEKKGVKFPLICRGNMTHFSLKLSQSPLKINLIQELS